MARILRCRESTESSELLRHVVLVDTQLTIYSVNVSKSEALKRSPIADPSLSRARHAALSRVEAPGRVAVYPDFDNARYFRLGCMKVHFKLFVLLGWNVCGA